MASYKEAVAWIAANDGAGDTPLDMEYPEALDNVRSMISVGLVADLWGLDATAVAADVLKQRGHRKPRARITTAL